MNSVFRRASAGFSNVSDRRWTSPNLPSKLSDNKFEFFPTSNYRPLEVSHQGATLKPMPATIFRTFPSRMNLVAASRQSSSIFTGNNDRVGIVDTPTGHGFCHLPPFRGFIDRPFPDDDSQGYLHEQFPYVITNMRIGEIGDEEVLVTTDDSGHVVVHFPKDNFSRPPLLLKVPISAWGIDTHSTKRLLAISCNAFIVTVFHLGMGIEGWEWTTTSPEDGEIPSIVMRQHTDNIPCVAFDQTGEYVVSGSLDCTVRMWDCKTGQLLGVVAATEQVWAVRFVNKCDFKRYQRTEEGISIVDHVDVEIEEAKIAEKQKRNRSIKVKLGWISRYSNNTQPENPPTETPDVDSDTLLQAALLDDISVGGFISDTELDAEFEFDNLLPLEDTAQPSASNNKPFDEHESLKALETQLLLVTNGSNLVLHDPSRFSTKEDTELIRRRLSSDSIYPDDRLYFWLQDVVPSMSMVFIGSTCRTAWIYRLVYFPDINVYDLVVEYKFPEYLARDRTSEDVFWPRRNSPYIGGVVQALRVDGVGNMAESRGVRIILISSDGEAMWWTVNRNNDEHIGIDEIVL